MTKYELIAPEHFPLVAPGDDLAALLIRSLAENGLAAHDGDAIVLTQKIVSKAENRYVDLRTVTPSAEAHARARECGKDPRLVEVILRESSEVLRCRPGLIIVRHRLGLVLANAGVDHSNITDSESGDRVLLLPADPDASAARLRDELRTRLGIDVAVLIIDSMGRAWRLGTCGICIGCAGFWPLRDLRGHKDLFGQELRATIIAAADELAAAASLLMGQTDEALPVVIARGLAGRGPAAPATALVRPVEDDLFP